MSWAAISEWHELVCARGDLDLCEIYWFLGYGMMRAIRLKIKDCGLVPLECGNGAISTYDAGQNCDSLLPNHFMATTLTCAGDGHPGNGNYGDICNATRDKIRLRCAA
jgi:hypothetical protein